MILTEEERTLIIELHCQTRTEAITRLQQLQSNETDHQIQQMLGQTIRQLVAATDSDYQEEVR